MLFLWDNKIDDAILTPSSELLSRPIENVQDSDLSKQFAMDSNSGNIVIDLNNSEYISDVMLLGTNITSTGNITLEGSTTDNFSSPDYSSSMDVYSNGNCGIKDVDSTYQYWRVVITDTSISDILIGWLYIGERLQLPGIDPSVNLNYHTNTAATFSVSQQIYANTGVEYFSSSFSFPVITDEVVQYDGVDIATREDILEFWYSNRGAKPIVLVIWDNDRERFPPIVGVVAQDTLSFNMDRNQGSYGLDFDFVETK